METPWHIFHTFPSMRVGCFRTYPKANSNNTFFHHRETFHFPSKLFVQWIDFPNRIRSEALIGLKPQRSQEIILFPKTTALIKPFIVFGGLCAASNQMVWWRFVFPNYNVRLHCACLNNWSGAVCCSCSFLVWIIRVKCFLSKIILVFVNWCRYLSRKFIVNKIMCVYRSSNINFKFSLKENIFIKCILLIVLQHKCDLKNRNT